MAAYSRCMDYRPALARMLVERAWPLCARFVSPLPRLREVVLNGVPPTEDLEITQPCDFLGEDECRKEVSAAVRNDTTLAAWLDTSSQSPSFREPVLGPDLRHFARHAIGRHSGINGRRR